MIDEGVFRLVIGGVGELSRTGRDGQVDGKQQKRYSNAGKVFVCRMAAGDRTIRFGVQVFSLITIDDIPGCFV